MVKSNAATISKMRKVPPEHNAATKLSDDFVKNSDAILHLAKRWSWSSSREGQRKDAPKAKSASGRHPRLP